MGAQKALQMDLKPQKTTVNAHVILSPTAGVIPRQVRTDIPGFQETGA